MQEFTYLMGGYILWVASYGNLKFKKSAAMRPVGILDKLLELSGSLGSLLFIPHMIGMAFIFQWWYPFAYLVGGALLFSVIFRSSLWPTLLSVMAVYAPPIGIALVVISFSIKN